MSESGAKFEVKELRLSKSKVAEGSTIQASVEVMNTGGEKGSFEVKLTLNGEIYDSKPVELKAGKSETVEFSVEEQELGEHTISVEDRTESFEVVKPANFVVSDLKIENKEVEPGVSTKISASIKNTGGIQGSHEVKLYIDDSLETSDEVELDEGESAEVSFKVSKENSKTYTVQIGELTETFKVIKAKKLEVEELSITPSMVGPGDTVNIFARVSNISEEDVESELELKIDGEAERVLDLSLQKGEDRSISILLRREEKKEYTVELGDKSKKFSVVSVADTNSLYSDSGSPQEVISQNWSGAEWGMPEAEFDNNFSEMEVPEGNNCYKVSIGKEDGNYAGFGFFYGEVDDEGNIVEKSSIDLSAYHYLSFWVKSPESVTVEIETLGGDKAGVESANYGWHEDESEEWQKITVPLQGFELDQYSEIYGPFLITLVTPDESFYVDNVKWVSVEEGIRPPSADFDLSPGSPSALESIQFTSESTDPQDSIDSYSWSFGDGTTSTTENPTHTYSENGIYTIELTVTNEAGLSDTYSQELVVGNPPPTAGFTYQPEAPDVGEEIEFIDNSSDYEGSIESHAWSFGDGTTSTTENPTHTYSENGIYTIELTVTDDGGATDTYKWDIPVGVYLENENWQVTWLEEFEEDSLNTSAWTPETGGWGWGNEELQYYTGRETNVRTENSKLIIEAQEEDYKQRDYTSARIKTQNKRSWTYGKIEARIKLPYGQGIWPAFWMLGESFEDVGWPACGEIDIMELVGHEPDTIHGTVHYQDADGLHDSVGDKTNLDTGTFADSYHTFGIEWDSQEIRWYMDGKQYHSFDITGEEMNAFHEDFFIIMNIAVGGNWPGAPDETTEFPQQMSVDWVRISQKP